MPIGRIGEFEIEDRRILLRLLQPVTWCFVCGFGFNDSYYEIACVAHEIVRSFLWPTADFLSN